MPETIALVPVGVVRTSASDDDIRQRWLEVESHIEIFPEYAPAIEGIDAFLHLIVLFLLHRLEVTAHETLPVKPRGLLRHGLRLDDLPTLGVFACDSPVRPNPIGLSVVQVLGREGTTLIVKGLDAFDGSPVLDLKPYTSDRAIGAVQTPRWHQALLEKTRAPRV